MIDTPDVDLIPVKLSIGAFKSYARGLNIRIRIGRIETNIERMKLENEFLLERLLIAAPSTRYV